MRVKRRFVEVPGEPTKIASRAAVRLAHLGDIVEPLSEIEFIWRPQEAERYLFRCPEAVQVAVVPTEPGQCAAVFDWQRCHWPRGLRGLPTALALLSLAALILAPTSWSAWRLAMAALPLLMLLAAPSIMDSGWWQRLHDCVRVGPTIPFRNVPEAERWLALEAAQRHEVVAELEHAAERESEAEGEDGGGQGGSEEKRLGWPLVHIAWGPNHITGGEWVARGWKAIGTRPLGQLAYGPNARAWLAVANVAVGLVALDWGASVGLVAAGGFLALGTLIAVGVAAVAAAAVGPFSTGMLGARHGPDLFLEWGFMAGFVLLAAALLAVRDWFADELRLPRLGLVRLWRRPFRRRVQHCLAEYRQSLGPADNAGLSVAPRMPETSMQSAA